MRRTLPDLTQQNVNLSVTGVGQGFIIYGTQHPRDASSKGHKIHGIRNSRQVIQGHIVQGYNILSPIKLGQEIRLY
jgi:hypothetical protein